EAATSPFLRTLSPLEETAGNALEVKSLEMKELSPAESRDLALSLLGEQAGPRAEAIARESGGSPFFIDELVRSGETGSAAPGDGRRRAIAGAARRMPPPSRHRARGRGRQRPGGARGALPGGGRAREGGRIRGESGREGRPRARLRPCGAALRARPRARGGSR